MSFSDPLGSYPDRDEFQVGRTLVWVVYPPSSNRTDCLFRAEAIFPTLESDIPEVEKLATVNTGSTFPATVIGITVNADGSASYECTFFEGAYEDELISISRDTNGRLVAGRT